jgi:hypothetical protein
LPKFAGSDGARRSREGVVPEGAEVWSLRESLFQHYRQARRYQALVHQDMSPVWREAYRAPRGDRLLFRLYDVLAVAIFGGPHLPASDWWQHPAIDHYLATLLQIGPQRLGLADTAGITPDWAIGWLHADFSEREREYVRRTRVVVTSKRTPEPRHAPVCVLRVSPCSVTLDLKGPMIEEGDEVVDAQVMPTLGLIYDQAHWNALEREATQALRFGLLAMREQMEASHPRRRPSTLLRQNEDIGRLFRWLYLGQRPGDRATRQRLGGICHRIGIVVPPGKRLLPRDPKGID